MGCVYFIKHNHSDYIKIGMSSEDTPEERVKSISTYAPVGVTLIGYVITDSPEAMERIIHNKYKNERLKGEWFKLSIERCRDELSSHENHVDEIFHNTSKHLKEVDDIEKLLKSLNISYKESVDLLVLLSKYLKLNTISEMARKEGKSPNGIKSSKRYKKIMIGKQKFAIKGIKDFEFPF